MTFRSILLLPLFLAITAAAVSARADDASPICTDRPTKANVPCTVPEGTWQLETDIGNDTHDAHGGSSTDTLYYLNPYLKYGLGPRTDIEVSWAPSVRVHTHTAGEGRSVTGAGDMYIRLKTNLLTGEVFSASIIPFVKAPTASHDIGNGRWEGGVALPVSIFAGGGFTVILGPELDALADADRHGRHLSVTNLINVSHSLTSKLSMAVEYWRQDNRDPSGHITQESGDVAFVYSVNSNFQLDLGGNFGLNRATPDQQVYLGASYRW